MEQLNLFVLKPNMNNKDTESLSKKPYKDTESDCGYCCPHCGRDFQSGNIRTEKQRIFLQHLASLFKEGE